MLSYRGKNRTVPRYACHRGHVDSGEPKCIAFGGQKVDEAVVHETLRVVEPWAVDAAILAADEESARTDKLINALSIELQAARYAAERARRQYDAVEPENRLVAAEAMIFVHRT